MRVLIAVYSDDCSMLCEASTLSYSLSESCLFWKAPPVGFRCCRHDTDRHMYVQILGEGDLIAPLTIKAVQFSEQAREKIEKAGGTIVQLPAKIKWTKAIGKERKAEQAATPAAKK